MTDGSASISPKPLRSAKRRLMFVLIAGALAIVGALIAGYYFAVRPVTLKIAVGPANSDDLKVVQALAPLPAFDGFIRALSRFVANFAVDECAAPASRAALARALRGGGRLIGIHSHGGDPGLEIIQAVWPGENPFAVSRHEILRAVKYELGSAGRELNFNAYADNRSIFRYDMEALPNEVTGSIGTSTAFAAWNAAVYVAQIEDERLTETTENGRALEATREVLRKHNGLWFYDESYVISRRRD